MPLFVIPAIAQPKDNELIETATRAGVEVASLITAPLHELYPLFANAKTTIVQLEPEHVALLSRHAQQLLPELPVMVMSVPGCIYTRDFEMFATSFMMEEWDTFRRRLAKSGSLSHDQEQLEKRSPAAAHSERIQEADIQKSFDDHFNKAMIGDTADNADIEDGSDIGV